jgi:hypothetical protein
MRRQKRFNRYDEELGQPYIPRLLAGLSEDMLKRVVISIALASPSTRSLLFKLVMISYLLGVSTAVAVIWKGSWFFNWLSTFWR